MAVHYGPVRAAASQPASFGRRDKCQEMYALDASPRLLLSHPVSQHVRSATLNHSTTDKLTAPSFTATEMKSPRTLMAESASKTLSHISFHAACWSNATADVRL